jgi:hypothetical protein
MRRGLIGPAVVLAAVLAALAAGCNGSKEKGINKDRDKPQRGDQGSLVVPGERVRA